MGIRQKAPAEPECLLREHHGWRDDPAVSSRDSAITTVLQRVQDAALDRSVPVTEALRLCVAAGGRLGSTPLRDWALKELNGYEETDELPPYRKIGAALFIDYVLGRSWERGRQVTEGMVDADAREWINEIPLRGSVPVGLSGGRWVTP